MLLQKGHAAKKNKTTSAAKPFWWPKLQQDIQQKCDDCFACKMTGKSTNTQIPMTQVNYSPPAEKPNQEIHQETQTNFLYINF